VVEIHAMRSSGTVNADKEIPSFRHECVKETRLWSENVVGLYG